MVEWRAFKYGLSGSESENIKNGEGAGKDKVTREMKKWEWVSDRFGLEINGFWGWCSTRGFEGCCGTSGQSKMVTERLIDDEQGVFQIMEGMYLVLFLMQK